MLVNDISKLYFKLGFIREINENVYLSYTDMLKRWSGGFPLFAGRFYSECVFGENIDNMQVIEGQPTDSIIIKNLVYKDKVYKEAEIYTSVDNIHLNIKYGSNTLMIVAFIYKGEFTLGDGELVAGIHLFGGQFENADYGYATQVNLEFNVGRKSLATKLNIVGDECKVVTDGIQEILIAESINNLKKYIQKVPCIFSYRIPGSLGGLSDGCIHCSKNMHIICASAFESVVEEKVYLGLPPDIWSLDAEQYIAGIDFKFDDGLNLECLRSYSVYSNNIDKIISCARKIYRCSMPHVAYQYNLLKGLLEFKFNKTIYMGRHSIDMLNRIIYNFGDSDIVMHESALFSMSDQCRAVFKVRNKNTLKNLIAALRNVRADILNMGFTTRLKSNIALVIVPDEVDIEKIATKFVRIIHESEYNHWGYERLNSSEYWTNIIKELKEVNK